MIKFKIIMYTVEVFVNKQPAHSVMVGFTVAKELQLTEILWTPFGDGSHVAPIHKSVS